MTKRRIALIVLALAAVALSLLNASWLASPSGRLTVVANRGHTHPVRPGATGPCAAAQIVPPESRFVENTIQALQQALSFGAEAVAVDLRRTADGRMVAFRDETLDCRTNGSGRVADRTLAELKRLDVGYRYTPDRGATYPLRGWGVGGMPSVEDMLHALRYAPIIFVFRGSDPADADALAAEFARVGMPIDRRFGFIGPEPVLARIRALAPRAWTFSLAASERCLTEYRRSGWLGIVPESCRDKAVALTPGANWTVWGWPYRFLARLGGVGGRAMIVDGFDGEGLPRGLSGREQLEEVPHGFRGYLWIEDMAVTGRSLGR